MKRIFGIFLLAFTVSSCTTKMNENEYSTTLTAISGSPRLQSALKAECKKSVPKRSSRESLSNLALIMSTSESKAVRLYCNRIVNALARNKISYKDYTETKPGKLTPKIIKIIQGRI